MGLVEYLMYVSHTVTGPGIFALLAFSRISHESYYAAGIVAAVAVLGVVLTAMFPFSDLIDKYPGSFPRRSPLFSYLLNISFNLVVTIAVLLNVASQIYPEQGREIALIPVYVLLCCSRLCPSEATFYVQGSATIVFVIAIVLWVHSDRHARPEAGTDLSLLTIADLVLTQAYAATQPYSGVFYAAREWERPKWLWNAGKGTWFLNTQWNALANGSLTRAVLFIGLLLSQHAAVYHFLVPKSSPVGHFILVFYGSLLLFGCMLLGSSWFACLRDLAVQVSGSGTVGSKAVRLQHVLYALVVAGAYIFPLQLVELRLGLVAALLLMNFL